MAAAPGKSFVVRGSAAAPPGKPPAPRAMAVRHTSETDEHYSPPWLVQAARAALGGIDLDPASTEVANAVVGADRIFTRADNGCKREWLGRVYCNPPGGMTDDEERVVKQRCGITGSCGLPGGTQGSPGHTHHGIESSQKKWWFKLAREWWSGRVSSAVFVIFSIELLQSTQAKVPKVGDSGGDPSADLPIPLDFALCVPKMRVKYVRPDGTVGEQPTHASGVVLVSDDKETTRRFADALSPHGRVSLGPTALRALGR